MTILKTNSFDQGIYNCTVMFINGMISDQLIIESEYLEKMSIKIEEFFIVGNQIEVLWFREQDSQSTTSTFKLDEIRVLAVIEDMWNDEYQDWVNVFRSGALLYDFKDYAQNEQILPLLNHYLKQAS